MIFIQIQLITFLNSIKIIINELNHFNDNNSTEIN